MAGPADLFDLTGRVAVVTGAGSGLGAVFARVFAEAGASVVVADREADRAAEIAAAIRGDGGAAQAVTVDVADEASVAAMAEGLQGVHVLVNNAGVTTVARRVHELPLAAWQEVIGINLTGAFLCSRALIPKMLEAGCGSIVNISSILGLVGHYPGFDMVNACYSASKAGLIGLTRQTAVEYATDGIRANAIAPGWHGGTRLGQAARPNPTNAEIARFEDSIVTGTPMARRGLPEELGGLALYLASDASRYLTGQVIAHDGGWTAR